MTMTETTKDTSNIPLLWIDLETTGLDEVNGYLLEVATIATATDLRPVREDSWLVLPPKDYREKCNDYVTEMHTDNGLFGEIDAIRHGNPDLHLGYELESVEQHILNMLEELGIKPGAPMDDRPYLAGSSVSTFDILWMRKHLPKVVACFHYRVLDVSGLKTLIRLFFPEIEIPPKGGVHRGAVDIQESLHLFQHFLTQLRLVGASVETKDMLAILTDSCRLQRTYIRDLQMHVTESHSMNIGTQRETANLLLTVAQKTLKGEG